MQQFRENQRKLYEQMAEKEREEKELAAMKPAIKRWQPNLFSK